MKNDIEPEDARAARASCAELLGRLLYDLDFAGIGESTWADADPLVRLRYRDDALRRLTLIDFLELVREGVGISRATPTPKPPPCPHCARYREALERLRTDLSLSSRIADNRWVAELDALLDEP